MGYKENVVKIANSKKTSFERGDTIIKEMSRLTSDILDFRYAAEHYDGNGTVLSDKKNSIKNSLIILMSDLDVYIEQLGLTEEIKKQENKRLDRIADKIST